MYTYKQIKKIHLEVTQNCQASCPMCARNMNGKGINPHLNLDELTLDDCKRIFDTDFIKQLETMYMCGNFGDPIVAQDTLEIFRYFRNNNDKIFLSMHTNGGARDNKWWRELAHIFGKRGVVYFSVDGLKDTNHIYRQNVIWDNVERSMRAFIGAGGRARWDYLIFEHNEHQVDEAEEFSKQLGFEEFRRKKTGRFVTTEQVKKKSHQAVSKKGEKAAELKLPKDSNNRNAELDKAEKIEKKHGSMDAYYDATEIFCKAKDEDELFISAEGLALPCCWTGDRMYKWWHENPKKEKIWDYIDGAGGKDVISAKKHGLAAVFDSGFFDDIQGSWSKPSCAAGKLEVCAQKCGKEWRPFEAQFK